MHLFEVCKMSAGGDLIAKVKAKDHYEAAQKATKARSAFGQRLRWARVAGPTGTECGIYKGWIRAGIACQNFVGPQVFIRIIG